MFRYPLYDDVLFTDLSNYKNTTLILKPLYLLLLIFARKKYTFIYVNS